MKISSCAKATVIGFAAIILWGMLALLSSFNQNIPTLQLTSMTFFIGFLVGVAVFIKNGSDFSLLKQPLAVWVNGIVGLFGYHFFYFTALKNAPPIEASLINYLWPLLIVVFSSFLPDERLRWHHICGVILGFGGVAILILQGGGLTLKPEYIFGYATALLCAVIWAAYSVISRSQKGVPTVLIGAYCGITAILSFGCHLFFEQTVMPNALEWLTILLLGLGPMGCAFFVWDYGMKKGNIKLLGTLAYFAPLLSSALLVCFGKAEPTLKLLLSCLLIMGGAAVAALDNLRGRPKSSV